jgi:hypothetical protein
LELAVCAGACTVADSFSSTVLLSTAVLRPRSTTRFSVRVERLMCSRVHSLTEFVWKPRATSSADALGQETCARSTRRGERSPKHVQSSALATLTMHVAASSSLPTYQHGPMSAESETRAFCNLQAPHALIRSHVCLELVSPASFCSCIHRKRPARLPHPNSFTHTHQCRCIACKQQRTASRASAP